MARMQPEFGLVGVVDRRALAALVALYCVCLSPFSLGLLAADGPKSAAGKAKPAAKSGGSQVPATQAVEKPDIVAVVNGEPISRNDLGREALRHFGEDVLESLVNKHLIAQHCKERNITVSRQEVQAEIDRMAERFQLPTDRWLQMLKEERGIKPEQYARDIIWPTVALRKLADARLKVSPKEIQEAYETYYGPAIQTRLIACDTLEDARRVHGLAIKNPDNFGNLAKQYSKDPNSASAKGLIQPIRRHLGDPKIGDVAFRMKRDEISEIIAVGDQYVILKCESVLQPQPIPLEQVEKILVEGIRDKKLRLVSGEVFEELQASSKVENIFNDPVKRKQQPGVAALINGQKMTIRELAEECIERHGKEVLEGLISRRLLEQACKRSQIEVTEEEMEEEIARAAVSMGKVKGNDEPDIEAWLKYTTEEQGLTLEMYRNDVVWPSVALKKLVDTGVNVEEDDLRKGFEANYGPRVRCRAIVFSQQRKAQEVWAKARDNPTAEYFGDLAEEYSVEAGSRAMRGEVPPIQRHGGQPLIEEEAFNLKPGELSGIINVDDKFVILFCEGRTEPTDVDFNEVRDLIYEDLVEKKTRLAMAQEYSRLQDAAQIDNYLAGTSRSPTKGKDPSKIGARPAPTKGQSLPGESLTPATATRPGETKVR